MNIVMGENLVWNAQVKIGSHHYGQLFAQENRVFWLSLPWNPIHLLIKGRKEERIRHWAPRGPVKIHDNLYCLSPLTLLPYRNNPIIRHKRFAKLALDYCLPNIPAVLKRYDFDPVDMLWLTDPRMLHLADKVPHKTLFYRCVDDFSSFSDIPASVTDLERELVQKADVVYATSSSLLEKVRRWRSDAIYLPNGVNYEFFSESNDPDLLPECFKKTDKPIVTYVGTIGEWFDVDLIRQTALDLPEVNFFIFGPIRRDVAALKNIPNLVLYGPVSYQAVPTIMKHSNVGIIPFVINQLTDAVNPIKLFEYLACGLPVVTPRTREAKKIDSPALLYTTLQEFIEAIRTTLRAGKDHPEYARFAARNSWTARFEIIKQSYAELVTEKQR